MNKSPAFQFYPDKWQSHTKRLSNAGYRVFFELICWMWQHSPDRCSIESKPEAIACAVAMPLHEVRIAIDDIQNPFSPLLKEENGRWISNGLKKEAEKQENRRKTASSNANSRWRKDDATASKNDAAASFLQCSSSSSSSPSPFHKDHKASGKRFTEHQTQMTSRFHLALNSEWENDRQKWMGRIKNETGKAERVLAEVESALKESRIKTSAARYAEQIWKEFR